MAAIERSIVSDRDWDSCGGSIYELFSRQVQAGWLVDRDPKITIDLAEHKLAEFRQAHPPFISIATLDPIEFIATFMAGWRLGIPIFLCNPQWGTAEWAHVSNLTAQVNRQQHQNLVMIPTGGSSGEIEFVMHTWQTLSASVRGFQEFYAIEKINSVCMLPLYHVSGLMQLMRSLLTDGKFWIVDFHQLCKVPKSFPEKVDLRNYFISLVPTQLSKLLDLDPSWLAQFQTILLGGAPPKIKLLNKARITRLPLALTYGMTETASQVTSLKPVEFLAGNHSCGRALPHAKIQLISNDDDRFQSIQIQASSLMLGYFPDFNPLTYFDTDDLGAFDRNGYLTIIGRNSSKIITGGENVFPIEVINAIMSTELVADVWVIGLPDRYWGQIITAVYVEKDDAVSGDLLARAIAGKISNYKIPKLWFPTTELPRNTLGKILTQEVEKFASARRLFNN